MRSISAAPASNTPHEAISVFAPAAPGAPYGGEDVVVFLDADHSDYPEDLPDVLAPSPTPAILVALHQGVREPSEPLVCRGDGAASACPPGGKFKHRQ